MSKPQVNVNTASGTPNQAILRNGMTHNQGPLPNQGSTFSAPVNTAAGTHLTKSVMNVFHDPAVRKIIREQVDMGNIYSTADDNHFKSTMNG
ncbi:hypothetical protein GUJ93_ZPchr0002g26210 [Zizania palustris]|uniref:Uncharacterized protein n=1 Tax=Zizania palustris TaxID=103762 RepID=A0A8J5VC47_ZIZPA|nr:hypothetical protein GUJ93_ZPchr0002g26210 [Zizania palustris]